MGNRRVVATVDITFKTSKKHFGLIELVVAEVNQKPQFGFANSEFEWCQSHQFELPCRSFGSAEPLPRESERC